MHANVFTEQMCGLTIIFSKTEHNAYQIFDFYISGFYIRLKHSIISYLLKLV